MPYWVYILKCRDNSFYTGVTSNLEKRVYEHNTGMMPGCYTKSRRPIKLVYSEMFNDVVEAIQAEKQIQGWRRAKKKALIEGNFEALRYLSKTSKCHPSTSSG